VPLSEFQAGGPGKDGIPAVDVPRFTAVGSVGFLQDREPVIELVVDGDARAYPIQILIWHEIVNDAVGGVPVAVTFCPLCNTALVFDRRLGGTTLDFGTTGNLRNSDLVMYDRQTESWWQQFGGRALVGKLVGRRLDRVPSRIVAWADFRRTHPSGQVLSRETGHTRPYGRNPYVGYDSVGSPPFFPTKNSGDDRLRPKERVVFVERGDEAVAVPFTTCGRGRSCDSRWAGRSFSSAGAPASHPRSTDPASPTAATSAPRRSSRRAASSPLTSRSGSPSPRSGRAYGSCARHRPLPLDHSRSAA